MKKDEIQRAIGVHGLWKGRLKQAIEKKSSDVHVNVVQQDNQCEFGKWLYGSDLTPAEKTSPSYLECKSLHQQFHSAAAGVLGLALAGKGHEASRAMESNGEFTKSSVALTRAMSTWLQTAK